MSVVFTFVTAVAEKQRVFVVPAVTELAVGLHDGLVPGDGRLQHVEGHGHLGGRRGLPKAVPPNDEALGQHFFVVGAVGVVFVIIVLIFMAFFLLDVLSVFGGRGVAIGRLFLLLGF